MGLKLNDVKTITETDINVFLSAYLTRKVQYNDVDPDKKILESDKESDKEILLTEINTV